MAFNLTGWPVVVVRAGTSPEGLPIGIQIVARPWHEHVALDPASMTVDPYLVAAKMTEDAVLAYHTALEFHGRANSVHWSLVYVSGNYSGIAADWGVIPSSEKTKKDQDLHWTPVCGVGTV